MKTAYFTTAALAAFAVTAGTASAQVQQQYQPMQVQPAATQASVINLDNRIVALERQLADMLRLGADAEEQHEQLGHGAGGEEGNQGIHETDLRVRSL